MDVTLWELPTGLTRTHPDSSQKCHGEDATQPGINTDTGAATTTGFPLVPLILPSFMFSFLAQFCYGEHIFQGLGDGADGAATLVLHGLPHF